MSARILLILLSIIAFSTALVFVYTASKPVALLLLVTAIVSITLTRLFTLKSDDPISDFSVEPASRSPYELKARLNDSYVLPDELLIATMKSMREAVIIVDREMRIIASNSAALDIFSGGEGSLESKRLAEVTRVPEIYDAFRTALDREERVEAKVEMRRGDKSSFELRVAPLRLLGASPVGGAIGVLFDITRLERLERVRQEFLSNVSHELRTPLTAILAFVETLEEGAIDDSQNNRRFLQVIRRNAERMHNLISDILELSSIEAGTVTVEPREVMLGQVVEDVTTSLAARADERHVNLRNEVKNGVTVYADPARLEQMITNLVDNAIKFNREGGRVEIRHESTADRDLISVSDTGDGISAEHIERIFERFYRVDRARARDIGGTGLGLAIVKHLSRAHGGEATVQSTPGEGSTFTIEIPKSRSQETEVRSQNLDAER